MTDELKLAISDAEKAKAKVREIRARIPREQEQVTRAQAVVKSSEAELRAAVSASGTAQLHVSDLEHREKHREQALAYKLGSLCDMVATTMPHSDPDYCEARDAYRRVMP
jgi:hypothetical protein